jgi:hypothetical protein
MLWSGCSAPAEVYKDKIFGAASAEYAEAQGHTFEMQSGKKSAAAPTWP